MLEHIAMMTLETGEDKKQTTDKGYVLETGKERKKKKKKMSIEKIFNELYYKNQFQSLSIRSRNETFQTHIYSK